LKRSLANLVKQDIGQLTALVSNRLRRMQYRPGFLEDFPAMTRLDLTPPRYSRNRSPLAARMRAGRQFNGEN
jgi:hypothetical protein